jgi:hypothetical protein
MPQLRGNDPILGLNKAAFKKSRELQQDSEAVQPDSPSSENEESDDQREEPCEGPSNEPL